MPPSPDTLRAKIGAILVRIVRQMLFWYTPQIHAFHHATAVLAENICAVMEKEMKAIERLTSEIAKLKLEIRVWTGEHSTQSLPPLGDRNPAYDHMLFLLRNSQLGTEEQREAELQKHSFAVESLAPPVPLGPWLDVGCGRGDWIKAIRSSGREIVGLETNTAAVLHCTRMGFEVTASDPVTYLRTSPDSSHAVISTLNVLDRYPADYALHLLREVARTLKPEGVLILECNNPASLAPGSEGVWRDPSVIRPWPASTAEFALEYFGLHVLSRWNVKAFPAEQQLPFSEFIQQLNSEIYAQRAYCLIARRLSRP
jgi:O-antigen chain-terminating methyltransferase